jgi:GNAT superfamily N-acetyltransferase
MKTRPAVVVRRAEPDETETINDLIRRSKAMWGYDTSFMRRAMDELALKPQEVAVQPVFVAETNGRLAGMCDLKRIDDTTVLLDRLFVDPDHVRQGVGRALWHAAVHQARRLGARRLVLEADPNAEGFYRSVGAVRYGARESAIPGRYIPLMACDLAGDI